MCLSKIKRYTIVQNLSDHEGYNGEEVRIIEKFKDDYYMVGNDNGGLWFCGRRTKRIMSAKYAMIKSLLNVKNAVIKSLLNLKNAVINHYFLNKIQIS